MPRPAPLTLELPKNQSAVSSTMASPTGGGSSLSSPGMRAIPVPSSGANRQHQAIKSLPYESTQPQSPPTLQPSSLEITSLPACPPSPKESPRHVKESSKGFFSNLKASKSSNKVNFEPTIRQVSEDTPRHQIGYHQQALYSLHQGSGSTPDLSISSYNLASAEDQQGWTSQRQEVSNRPTPVSIHSDNATTITPTEPPYSRKPKPRFSNLIGRTRSTRVDDVGRQLKPSSPITASEALRRMQHDENSDNDDSRRPPRTAPLNPNKPLHDMMSSGMRGHSADRQSSNHSSENVASRRIGPPSSSSNSTSNLSNSTSGLTREGAGSNLFANIKNHSAKAADGLGRAGKGLFSRKDRRPSSTGKEDENYVIKIINLPLVEQTRKTRIAIRLEDSKDKTEFWMPALPWRCIDYLNFRGCEEEGLYRIPGSDLQVRKWQRRFDKEGDINLFDEHDLFDVNIIGSMFKAWLRELPTEILPKDVQARIARECANDMQVPQVLKDELSMLPPWNYYLLFAITCHLSLLSACSDKNKMTYNNLCICFQPALKVDAICFNFLVNHWRDCWQGCYTEKEYLDEEYRMLDGVTSSSSGSSRSSTSSVITVVEDPPKTSPPKKSTAKKTNHGRPVALNLTRAGDQPPPSTPAGFGPELNGYATTTSHLPELAPVKPLSPLMDKY